MTNNMPKFIDLSHPITSDMPIYPGDPKTKIEAISDLEKEGFIQHLLSMCTHSGTHIDAPYHMLKGGKKLDMYDVEDFIGRGFYIKFDKSFKFSDLEQLDIRQGDIILLHTGMDSLYNSPDYFDSYPNIDEEIAKYLTAKKVKIVGSDMCSVDTKEASPVHKIFLENNILILENLTNLQSLEGHEFRVYALPIKLKLDGAPVRVIAEILNS